MFPRIDPMDDNSRLQSHLPTFTSRRSNRAQLPKVRFTKYQHGPLGVVLRKTFTYPRLLSPGRLLRLSVLYLSNVWCLLPYGMNLTGRLCVGATMLLSKINFAARSVEHNLQASLKRLSKLFQPSQLHVVPNLFASLAQDVYLLGPSSLQIVSKLPVCIHPAQRPRLRAIRQQPISDTKTEYVPSRFKMLTTSRRCSCS